MDSKLIDALVKIGLITNIGIDAANFNSIDDLLDKGIITVPCSKENILKLLNMPEPTVEEPVQVEEKEVETVVEEQTQTEEKEVETVVEEQVQVEEKEVETVVEEPAVVSKKKKQTNKAE
jgi:hypothetical protein